MWENVQVYPVESLKTSVLVGHEPDSPVRLPTTFKKVGDTDMNGSLNNNL